MKEYIGVDIGGTKCAVVKANADGNILEKIKFDTESRDGTLSKIISGIKKFQTAQTARVGISCGGPLNGARGVILSPPNLPGWDNVCITELIETETGLSARLCNDANACALAEWKYGAGRGTKNMVFLTFGTGMGAGLIIDGKLYEGSSDTAGEIGHMKIAARGPIGYGKAGSFEGFCSGGGIARLGRAEAEKALSAGNPPLYCESAAELDKITAKSIAEAALGGDKTAIKVYRKSGEALGMALAAIVDILNPEIIVIGSVFARAEALLRPHMEKTLRREALGTALNVCKVVPAALGDGVGDVAAVAVAMT